MDGVAIAGRFRKLIPAILIFLTVSFIWHLYYFSQFSDFFPDTLRVKMAQGASGKWPLFYAFLPKRLAMVGTYSPLLAIIACVGAFRLMRTFPLLLLWPLAHAAAFTALKIPFYHWYYSTLQYVVLTAFLLGLTEVLSFAWQYGGGGRIIAALLAVLVTVYAYHGVSYSKIFDAKALLREIATPLEQRWIGKDPRYTVYHQVADWLKAGKGDHRPTVVLADEVGILGFYLPGYELRDSVGLATPGLEASDLLNYGLVIHRYGVQYLVASFGLPLEEIPKEAIFQYQNAKYVYQFQSVAGFEFEGRFSSRILKRIK